MRFLRATLARLCGMFGRSRRERELAAELDAHVEMQVDDSVRSGLSPEEARRLALIGLGGLEQTKERYRDRRGLPWLETLTQDIRYGLRVLWKSPGFTVIAVATLALGIGANSALFSVVNGVLINPLPYPDPDRLITLHESKPNFAAGSLSYPNFQDWQAENRTFSSMAISRPNSFSLTGPGAAEQVQGLYVSSEFFPILGVKPVIGRFLAPGEDAIGAHPLAMVSADFGRRKFGSPREALGRNVTLDGMDYPIIGVVPSGFDLRLRSTTLREVYLPIGQWGNPLLSNRSAGLGIHGVGRLKAGVTLAEAKSDMDRVARNLAAEYPTKDKGVGATLIPLRELVVGDIRPYLVALLAAVGFVLLIACVNVANLLLARSTSRSTELAIRVSLGAGRGRLLRQLLTESILLSLIGAGLGVLIASRGTRALMKMMSAAVPRASEVSFDGRVLCFTAAVSIAVGILFGLAPSLRATRLNAPASLKEGGRGTIGPRHRAQAIFVVLEVSLSLVLLIGAGLMIRTLSGLWKVDPGFDPRNVLTFGLSLPPSMNGAGPAEVRAAVRALDDRLASQPGVAAASLVWAAFPLGGDDEQLFWLDGEPKPANTNDMRWALKYVVEPGYFKAMGIRLRHGRFLGPRDDEKAPLAVVIDDVFARTFFGTSDPVGQRLNIDDFDTQGQIVGVVAHVKQWGIAADDAVGQLRAQMYLPCLQMPDSFLALASSGMGVVVRSSRPDPGLFRELRASLQSMNSQQTVYAPQTMEEIISGSLLARQYSMILLGSFAALSLLLSGIGIYGVISYVVGSRRNEIGVRMALGAGRGDILKMIVGQGGRLAVAGTGVGIVAAIGLTRLMSGLLFGVSALDPLTFAGMAIVVLAVAAFACYVPARNAANLEPIAALHEE